MRVVIVPMNDENDAQEVNELMPNDEILARLAPEELIGKRIDDAHYDDRGRVLLELA